MISFNIPEARDFLVGNGFVYTVRKVRRPTGRQRLYLDRKPAGYANVLRVGTYDEETLFKRVQESGFDCVACWQRAIEKMHGKNPKGLAVYQVSRLPGPTSGFESLLKDAKPVG